MPVIAELLQLDKARDAYPQLDFTVDGEKVKIGPHSEEPVITIQNEKGRWTLSTPEWHGHLEQVGQVFHATAAILGGLARTTREFRGEKLCATWIEVWDGEVYQVRNIAYYLNPFDRGEWELRQGEQWRQVRTERHLIDNPKLFEGMKEKPFELPLGETRVWEKTFEQPYICRANDDEHMFSRFEGELGPPHPATRWVNSNSRWFILQVPLGWRIPNESDANTRETMWVNPEESAALLVRAFFRDASHPSESLKEEYIVPDSVNYDFKAISSEDDVNIHQWTLMFSDGQEEMMAQIVLLPRPGKGLASEHIRDLLDQTLPNARMGWVFPD